MNKMHRLNVTAQHDIALATITQEAGSITAMNEINSNNTPLTIKLYVEYNIIVDSPTMLSEF